ncbi:glutathione S-transferase family protein [Haloarcula salinisoli]|uniref:Glutathione S-transferase C-terminal domain-containing protein n=1 Tax=Haloarcula salinisoli TaxID=2487746 RepID=A0A8J8C893_9EURY|nr:glutathione S-transferase C-terminal domain-containing protein [Halomicroarcula salinisoli]MBX0286849.1 glutathione S-transferase C-terminal domain-containing protein [Halomicroarcula salinisoli]MBX0304151.1 glutathione S-transferase C-terminal domain-containing protein [Halomicroarcula salinisoli]
MGVLDNGEWKPDATRDEYDHDSFDSRVRAATDATFPAEADRYHLYISRACPWAHRAALTRRLLGLDGVVSMDVVDPVRRDAGWEFTPARDGCTADSVHGAERLYEVFQTADPEYTGPVTVPVLVDRETGTIVHEESADISRMLATEFTEFQSADRDLYPESLRGEIDDAIDDVHAGVNTGVYDAGFADSQAEYEAAVEDLFTAMERWDDRLADQRYAVGDQLTLADVFLFPTLYRFDAVYHTHFKCNVRPLVDFDHLWDYARDIYQTGDAESTTVAATCNMDHAKAHYYRSHTDINPTGFVPVGPEADWTATHGRAALAADSDSSS